MLNYCTILSLFLTVFFFFFVLFDLSSFFFFFFFNDTATTEIYTLSLHDALPILAHYYSFAAFHLDRNFEVKEAIGDFKRYLSLPEKSLNLNILKMVPADLSYKIGRAHV